MGASSEFPPPHHEKRSVFILRLWSRRHDGEEWIGEVQDVRTGEKAHVQGLKALFDWLKQKTAPDPEPPNGTGQ